MSKVLYVKASINGPGSRSASIADVFVESLKEANPGTTVIGRDLAAAPLPLFDAEAIYAGYTPEDARTESQTAKHAVRIGLADELLAADEIVIASPMWNWNVPGSLKNWIDGWVIPGYLGGGESKLRGKRVTICASLGGARRVGLHIGNDGMDYMTGYLVMLFQAMGVKDVDVIVAEYGLAGMVPSLADKVEDKTASEEAAKAAAKARGASPLIPHSPRP